VAKRFTRANFSYDVTILGGCCRNLEVFISNNSNT